MTTLEFFLSIIWQILWPPKGIIYAEEQAVQWCVAIMHAYFSEYGYILLIVFGILFAIACTYRVPRICAGGIVRRIIRAILNCIFVILFAWVFLIYGALRGTLEVEGETRECRLQVEHNYRIHITNNSNIMYRFARFSLHFHLGRWLFRISYRLLGYIPAISNNYRVRRVIARLIAMVIILWGVWNIPYDLTH